MTSYHEQFNGLGRDQIERIAIVAIRLAEKRERDARLLTEHLTDVQARCTELLLRVRELEAGIVLQGWRCMSTTCQGVFNGTEKENLTHCRCCGEPRPT